MAGLTDRTPEQSELLAAIVNSSGDAITSCTLGGIVTSWNPGAERMYGYRATEIVGKSGQVLMTDAHPEELTDELARVKRGESFTNFQTLRRHKNGRLIPVALTLGPIRDGNGKVIGASAVARDVTEHRKLEEHLRVAIEASPVGLIMVGQDGRVNLVNSQVEALFGYSREELLGMPVDSLVPAKARSGHHHLRDGFWNRPEFRRMGAGRDLFALRKDGSEFPVEIGLSPIKTDEGTSVLATIVDITERKRMEARLVATIDASPVGMVMVAGDGAITMVNAQMESLFGYSRQELLTASIDQLVPSRFVPGHPHLRHGFFARPESREMGAGRDLFALRKDGSEFPVEIGLSPIETEEGISVLATVVDITERKRLEDRLIATIDASPVGMVMVNAQGKIALVNGQIEALFGYKREEIVGNSIDILVPGRLRRGHKSLRDGFFLTPEARSMGVGRDLFACRKDGSEFPVEVGLSPIQTNEGLVVLATVVDITERKRAEHELVARTAELQRSNSDLEQFAYLASHDLQEPLRMVSSYVQLLAERYENNLDERANKYIFYAVDGAKRMQRLVNDILSYSRIDTQGKPLEPVDSGNVVGWVLRGMETAIAEQGATVTIGELPTVLADEVQLGQVFQNLIGNAIKFSGDAPPVIEVGAISQKAYCEFSVKDNGLGIDPQYSEKVFQMFQRLHEHGKFEGSGMGLALSKRIVERHGGKIWFDSTPGNGCTFRFTVKLASGETQ